MNDGLAQALNRRACNGDSISTDAMDEIARLRRARDALVGACEAALNAIMIRAKEYNRGMMNKYESDASAALRAALAQAKAP